MRILTLLLILVCPGMALCAPIGTYADFAKGKQRLEGYFPMLLDASGQVFLEIPAQRGEFIFQSSLPYGVGSNDIGLDRGQLGDTRLARFERVGAKVLLRQLNTRYRAVSNSDAERESAEQAFASSVLWGFPVVAQDQQRVVIDYTPFLLSDVHDIAGRLASTKQGKYAVKEDRSAPFLPNTRAFPKNTELEATLTFVGTEPGTELKSVVPDPYSVSVHTHHSMIELPEPGYQPRQFHPFSGYFPFDYIDYAQPLQESLVRRYIPRHRLQKKDPTAARSEAVKPIVYYLDPGTPEPVRSALLDGARWWNAAFEALGYIDAFQVRMLPADADPMDARYNTIQWVHRNTRGWSYGASVVDPRNGEIIKGHVTLGSQRVRQDLLIAQGLTSPFDGRADANDSLAPMALARLRQLSAHEVGHTLGLAHNFAASTTQNDSVMDYPHPRIDIAADGKSLDLSGAYGVGIGAWDRYAIAYGYADAGANPAAFLHSLVAEAQSKGMRYLSDQDARSIDTPSGTAHLWDNGSNPVTQLDHLMAARTIALDRFGANSIRADMPMSELANVLVPIYYLHRYQTEAVAKLVGGLDYSYAVKGDSQPMTLAPVDAQLQKSARAALLKNLSPEVLTINASIRALIPPPALAFDPTRESPPQRTGGTLDPVTMAEAAGEHTLSYLLAPERLARLQQQHAENAAIVDARQLFGELLDSTVKAPMPAGLASEVQQRVNLLAVEHVLSLGYGDEAAPEVRAAARLVASELDQWLKTAAKRTSSAQANYALLLSMIERAQQDGKFVRRADVAKLPPGAPI